MRNTKKYNSETNIVENNKRQDTVKSHLGRTWHTHIEKERLRW